VDRRQARHHQPRGRGGQDDRRPLTHRPSRGGGAITADAPGTGAAWIPRQGRLLDIGSGAGLPGIPLALARPELEVTLIDSVGKKAAFMQQAITTLGLDNARAVHGRVEDYPEPGAFDTVISRAFSSLAAGGTAR